MNKTSFIMAFITVAIWGSTFAAIQIGLEGGYPPGHLILIRYTIASFVFVIYALWPKTHFRLPDRQDIIKIFMLGVVGISLYHIGVSFGQQTVGAGTAGMIIGSSPIFTSIIAMIVLKEKLGRSGWTGLTIGFIGITIITLGTSSDDGSLFSIGVLLILMAAVMTSIFFVLQKPLLAKYNPFELTAYFTWAATIPFLIYLPNIGQSLQHATIEAHMSALYMGIFPSAIAYVTWAIALSLGNAGSVSSVMYIEPVFAVLIAWIWLQQWPSHISLIGGGIALFGVVVMNVRRSKKQTAIPY